MDALTLEQGALKLTPLSRIRLAELLYTSLEVEADREWNRKAIAECESRYEAYKNEEMGSSEGEEVVFVACFHLRSDPAKWRELLKTR